MLRRKAINLQVCRERLQKCLNKSGIDQPLNTSLLLLAAALDRPKTWVLAHNEYQPTPPEIKQLQNLSQRVADGQPLPYVLGQWDFYGRSFKVSPDALIPRPETESLVEMALGHARKINQPRIIDVGAGSGAIAISLAAELPGSRVFASDLSWAALKIARQNAQRLGQPEIHFLQANLLQPITAQFDLICANLPYIPTRKLQDLPVACWEPRLALDGGESGLDAITALLHQARTRLLPDGAILLEIEASLGAAAVTQGKKAFPEARTQLIQDLAGRDRILEIKRA